jgi:hypothetical protein
MKLLLLLFVWIVSTRIHQPNDTSQPDVLLAQSGSEPLNFIDLPGVPTALKRLSAPACVAAVGGRPRKDDPVEAFRATRAVLAAQPDAQEGIAASYRNTHWYYLPFFHLDDPQRNYLEGTRQMFQLGPGWSLDNFQALVHLHEFCHRDVCPNDSGCQAASKELIPPAGGG